MRNWKTYLSASKGNLNLCRNFRFCQTKKKLLRKFVTPPPLRKSFLPKMFRNTERFLYKILQFCDTKEVTKNLISSFGVVFRYQNTSKTLTNFSWRQTYSATFWETTFHGSQSFLESTNWQHQTPPETPKASSNTMRASLVNFWYCAVKVLTFFGETSQWFINFRAAELRSVNYYLLTASLTF